MNKKGTWMVIGLLLTVFLLLLESFACAKPAPTSVPAPAPTSPTSAPAAKEYNFIFSSFMAASDNQYSRSGNYFGKLLEQRSNGRIKMRVVTGGALLTVAEAAEGIAKGVAQFGGVYTPAYPDILVADSTLAGLLWFEYAGIDSLGQVLIHSKLIKEFPKWTEDYSKRGLKLLHPSPVGNWSLTLRWPMKSIDEFKGKKIRVSGTFLARLIESTGAAIVSMPWDQVYTSYATKVVDGGSGAPRSDVGARHYEVAPYLFEYGGLKGGMAMLATGVFVASLETWNKLPPDLQKLIEDASRETMLWTARETNVDIEKAWAEWKAGGGSVIFPSQDDLDKWKKWRPDLLGEAIKTLDAAGYPGKKMIERYDALWQDYKAGRLKAE